MNKEQQPTSDEANVGGGPEIRLLGDLQRISPQPGDVFVLSYNGWITERGRNAIKAEWDRVMPEHKLLVLEGGLKLEVIGGVSDLGNATETGFR